MLPLSAVFFFFLKPVFTTARLRKKSKVSSRAPLSQLSKKNLQNQTLPHVNDRKGKKKKSSVLSSPVACVGFLFFLLIVGSFMEARLAAIPRLHPFCSTCPYLTLSCCRSCYTHGGERLKLFNLNTSKDKSIRLMDVHFIFIIVFYNFKIL